MNNEANGFKSFPLAAKIGLMLLWGTIAFYGIHEAIQWYRLLHIMAALEML